MYSTGVRTDPELRGAIPRSFEHIYKHIARTVDQQYLVRASYLEIYQEEIRDLLSKDQTKRLELKERPDTGNAFHCVPLMSGKLLFPIVRDETHIQIKTSLAALLCSMQV